MNKKNNKNHERNSTYHVRRPTPPPHPWKEHRRLRIKKYEIKSVLCDRVA